LEGEGRDEEGWAPAPVVFGESLVAREVLLVGSVNAILFGMKRAHHGALNFMRPLLTHLGLTAARFDLLYALPQRVGSYNGLRQSTLRRRLGVSRPTVSRMLASLEELGLVRREREERDRRQISVSLTQRGFDLIRRAKKVFMSGGLAQLAVDTALVAEVDGQIVGSRRQTKSRCLLANETMGGLLRKIRYTFGDFAKLSYPLQPDH
jgi:DNA-binding MarR family transcriptional regulator